MHRLSALDRRSCLLDQLVVHRAVEMVVLLLAIVDRDTLARGRLVQDAAEIDALRLPVLDRPAHVEFFDVPYHLVEAAEAKLRHQLAHFLGDKEEEIDHVLRLAGELLAQHRVLRGDTDRTGVEMTLAHHDAAGGDQRRGGEAELIGTQQRADNHITAGAQSAIDLHRDAATQTVQHKRLLCLRKADLPRRAGVRQRCQRRGTGATLEARDRHMIGARFGDPGGNRADTDFGYQLYRNPRRRIGVLQIGNELGEIFDRIDVVMRRR